MPPAPPETAEAPTAVPPRPGFGPSRFPERGEYPALALGIALFVAVFYAVFANGAIGMPDANRLQIGIAAISLVTTAAVLQGGGVRFAAPRAALAGLGFLAAFAVWCGLSLAWSVTPDLTWIELNRAIAYALVAALGIALGASLPRAVERTALGFLVIATLAALYSLGGKMLPAADLIGIVELNHTAEFSRLRAPVGYWNALALLMALAVPLAVRVAAEPERSRGARITALCAFVPLVSTLTLTYSRGGIVTVAIASLLLVVASADRLRLLALYGVGLLGAAPATAVALASADLTGDGVPLGAREGDGLIVLLMFAAGLAATAFAGSFLIARESRLSLSRRAQRLIKRGAPALAGVLALAVVVAMAASDRGLTGTIEDRTRSFTNTDVTKQNDPGRVLETNSGNRWVWWKEAAGAWSDRPVEGHGAGSFPNLHLAYRTDRLEVRQAHSVPLQLLAETGLVGFLLVAGAMLALGWAAFGRIAAASGRDRRYAVALGAVLAAWSIHLWIDWDWNIPAAMLPVLVFLGVLAARRPGEPADAVPAGRLGPGWRSALLAFAALLLCAYAVSSLLPAMARDRTREALERGGSGDPEELVEAAERADEAQRLDPLSVEPLFAGATIAERRRQYGRVSELLEEAARRQPSNPEVWLRIARLEFLLGDARSGLRAADRSLELDPLAGFARAFFQSADFAPNSASATGTPLPEKAAPPTLLPPGTPVPPGAQTLPPGQTP